MKNSFSRIVGKISKALPTVISVPVVALILIGISLSIYLSVVSCTDKSDLKPIYRLNTKWVSENSDIYFVVSEDGDNTVCLGALKENEKPYNIIMEFNFGVDKRVFIRDYDALKKNNFIYEETQLLAKADCDFSEEKCVIKITESSLDSIEVGDKITFNLVDELPEWATQVIEPDDESD